MDAFLEAEVQRKCSPQSLFLFKVHNRVCALMRKLKSQVEMDTPVGSDVSHCSTGPEMVKWDFSVVQPPCCQRLSCSRGKAGSEESSSNQPGRLFPQKSFSQVQSEVFLPLTPEPPQSPGAGAWEPLLCLLCSCYSFFGSLPLGKGLPTHKRLPLLAQREFISLGTKISIHSQSF